MRIRANSFLVIALVCAGCFGVCPVERSQPAGQFGPYPEQTKLLRLASGDTFTVYRVKFWTFNNGSPPSLQLEYAPPVPTSDTASIRQLGERIWPAFAPYVEGVGLRRAFLTATNLEKVGGPGAWAIRSHHFGLIAQRDSLGAWRFDHHTEILPAAERDGIPRIFEANGAPLPIGKNASP